MVAILYQQACAGSVYELAMVTGPRATFTCEWMSGNTAVLKSDTGVTRLIETPDSLEVGVQYKIVRGPHFKGAGGQLHLIKV